MKKIIIITILVSLLFFGCATLKSLVKEPTIKFKTVKLRDLGLFDATVGFVFEVDNPNPIGVTVNDLEYNLKLDNKEFLSGILDDGIKLQANGKSTFEIPVNIDYIEFFGSVSEFLKHDELPYNISGKMKIFEFTIPYSNSGTIDIPSVPKVSLVGVEVGNISLSGAAMVFKVKMKNLSDAALNLSKLDYKINLAGKEFGSGIANISESLTANGEKLIDIPLNIDFLSLGAAASNIIRGDDASYKLEGNMEIAGPKGIKKQIPFNSSGNTSISN